MISTIFSLVFGMLPEVLYFTMFLIYTKNLKEKKLKLFLGIGIIYILCIMVNQYNLIYYILHIGLTYLLLKILYKNKAQITDIYIILFSCIYIALIGFICSRFLNEDLSNYFIIFIINRIALFSIFIFRKKFNNIYKSYYKFWNRNDNIKKPIKSITLRNISIIALNSFIFALNIAILSIINLLNK